MTNLRHPSIALRISVDGMRESMTALLEQRADEFAGQMQAAINSVLDSEHIERMLYDEARKCVDEALKQEVRAFFTYGKGRASLKEVVNTYLEERYGKTD